jgi:hypothetical protein
MLRIGLKKDELRGVFYVFNDNIENSRDIKHPIPI